MKKIFTWMCILFFSFGAMATMVQADSAVGDVIVTLGENLSPAQKEQLLDEMGVAKDVNTVTVTNAEEHKYLGDFIPKSQIGSRALSSSKITMKEKGYGIIVETNKISWVSKEMYTNALSTAGVKDADIYITAPTEVSGTAALTGLMKAYEVTTGEKIPEEQKKVANEEMVKTAELGDQIGEEKATELIQRIKEEVGAKNPQTIEEITIIINNITNELNIQLTQDQIDQLSALFDKMQNLDINWDQVNNQIDQAKEKWDEFKNSEEGQGIIQSIIDFLKSIIDAITGLFK